MMQACEYKTETSTWIQGYVLTGIEKMREHTVDGFGAPAITTILNYEVQEDGVVTEQRTVEAIELTVQLSNGKIAKIFARGFGQK